MPRLPRVYGDFNGLDRGYVPLDTHGSTEDLEAFGDAVQDGLSIVVFDDSCEADAVLERLGDEWSARIVSPIRDI